VSGNKAGKEGATVIVTGWIYNIKNGILNDIIDEPISGKLQR